MSQPELKHCPFCGGNPGILATPIAIYISCEKCNFDVVYEDGETADAAVNHWNTRAEPAIPMHQPVRCAKRAVEALEGLLAIVSDSFGVAGYHLNGEVAEWGEFEEVAAAEEALAAYRTQDDEIPMHTCIMQLDKMGDV